MTTREEALAYGLSFPDAYQEAPFHDPNWQLVRVKGSKKVFLWTYERDGYMNLNVKVSPEWRDFWRSAFPAVIPGWHQNREHWNTIILDGSIPDKDIRLMIDESYALVTDSPTKRIYEAVKKIPKGRVATYGQIAALIGRERNARLVGKVLSVADYYGDYPCHRVVNAAGRTAPHFFEQCALLEDEGVEFKENGTVDMKKYKWEC